MTQVFNVLLGLVHGLEIEHNGFYLSFKVFLSRRFFSDSPSTLVNSFTALRFLRAPPIHPLVLSNPWQLLIFTVSEVFPFPECHIVGVMQDIAFQIGFFT